MCSWLCVASCILCEICLFLFVVGFVLFGERSMLCLVWCVVSCLLAAVCALRVVCCLFHVVC